MSSHDWKQLGSNSGNMANNRNIKASKLTYDDGKWKNINDDSNKKIGIAHCVKNSVSNENVRVGIGTDEPFSRLSLGSNTGDGKNNSVNTSGQLASIAVHELKDGKDFNGLSYVQNVTARTQEGGELTNALGFFSNDSNTSLDLSGAAMYISNENVVTVGGLPRKAYRDYNNDIVTKNPVKLDCSGSVNVSGFISFLDYQNPVTNDNPANSEVSITDNTLRRNIPVGSIWTGLTGDSSGVALFIQDLSGRRQIIGTSNTSESGGSGDISGIVWDGSKNSLGLSWVGKGGSNLTFTPSTDIASIIGTNANPPTGGVYPPNAITLTRGNLSVVGKENYSKKIKNVVSYDKFNITDATDTSGGIIWAERQIAIGAKVTSIDIEPISLLDISGGIKNLPSLTVNSTSIDSATNSILLNVNDSLIGNAAQEKNDAKNSIVVGSSNQIHASDTSVILGETNIIGRSNIASYGKSGKQILNLGDNNTLVHEMKSLVVGDNNNLDSLNNQTDAGNFVFGTTNVYKSKKISYNNQNNFIMGKENSCIDSEFSIVSGNNNDSIGRYNYVFGNNNKLGSGVDIDPTTLSSTQITDHSLVVGNNNILKTKLNSTMTNKILLGNNNTYDGTDSSFVNDPNSTSLIFGSYGKVDWGSDLSNARFVFSTKERYSQTGTHGNVMTIDKLGNTNILGDLNVNNVFAGDLSANDVSFNTVDVVNELSASTINSSLVDTNNLVLNAASSQPTLTTKTDKGLLYFDKSDTTNLNLKMILYNSAGSETINQNIATQSWVSSQLSDGSAPVGAASQIKNSNDKSLSIGSSTKNIVLVSTTSGDRTYNMPANTGTLALQGEIPTSYIANASENTNGNTLTLTKNDNTTVTFGPFNNYSLPNDNIKNAGVSNNILTLTKNDNTTVAFGPFNNYSLPNDNIVNASENTSGNTLTLTKNDNTTVTFGPFNNYSLPSDNIVNASKNTGGNTLTLTKNDNTTVAFGPFNNYSLPNNNIVNAAVTNNTLTLTKNDNNTVTYGPWQPPPSSGSGISQSVSFKDPSDNTIVMTFSNGILTDVS